MSGELLVLLGEDEVGRLTRDERRRLRFTYDDTWRSRAEAAPISVSLPTSRTVHEGAILEAWLWGLLPDNEAILESWAKRFQVSARDPYELLSHVGDDCAGAVRFVSKARATKRRRDTIQWLDERDLAAHLRALRADESAWRLATDGGQFSLGGAQAKTALFFDGKAWGVPSGRRATSHILKPGASHLRGHAENEWFCLRLAREVGLPTAAARVARFEDEVAVVIERYDRRWEGRTLVRVHQEDICQALGVHPSMKYESTGGPGVRAIVGLLRERSRRPTEDVDTLVGAIAFHWITAGTDAHAKNYSVLIDAGGLVRLAPLYDLASFLPYAETRLRKLKLAMKIGGKYRLHEIGVHAFAKLADEVSLDRDEVRSKVVSLCDSIPDLASDLRARARREGATSRTVVALADMIQERARACARALVRT